MEINWHISPFARHVLLFATGILLQEYFPLPPIALWSVLAALTALFSIYTIAYGKLIKYSFTAWPALVISITMLFSGSLVRYYSDARLNDEHLTKVENYDYVIITLNDKPEEKSNTYRCIATARQVSVNGMLQTVNGKVVVFFDKDGYDSSLTYGDEVLVTAKFALIRAPKNPDEVDFRKQLNRQQIYQQALLTRNEWVKTGRSSTNPIYSAAYACRNYFLNQLNIYVEDKSAYGVAAALIVGKRNAIDTEISDAYANTGTVHVLAVSGLHVGILFAAFGFFLKFLDRKKTTKVIKTLILLFILWGYAAITGLSASVLRAVVMFTFVALGGAFNRKISIYNSLAASAFFILAIDPNQLFNVGFQLSYLAVLGIVAFQKPIYNKINARKTGRLPDWVWQLCSVSIAAQIAAFPLCLFYFHQFPVHFLLANLLVIPLGTCILWSGMILFIASYIPYLNYTVGYMLKSFVVMANGYVMWVERLPYSYINNIYSDGSITLLLYLFIIFLFIFFSTKKIRWLNAATVCIVVVMVLFTYWRYSINGRSEFIVYGVPGKEIISYTENEKAVILSNKPIDHKDPIYKYFIKPHFIKTGIEDVQFMQMAENTGRADLNFARPGNNIILAGGKNILLFNSFIPDINKYRNINFDLVVLGNNVKLSLKWLKEKIKFSKIIIDNSNNFYKAGKWLEEAHDLGLDIYSVLHENAYTEQLQ